MVQIKKHFLDKPVLRSLFWFIVLPYKLRLYSAENARLSELLTGKILDVKVDNGVNFTIQTKLALIMADSFESLFKGDKSPKNYVEYTFNGSESQILVTIQRKLGKTPHQLRAEAEDELKRYKESVW